MNYRNPILVIVLMTSLNAFSQYQMLGIPSGDCNKKELTLVDENETPITVLLTDANNQDRLCKWVDWTSSDTKIVNQVTTLVGLKSSSSNYALLSFIFARFKTLLEF